MGDAPQTDAEVEAVDDTVVGTAGATVNGREESAAPAPCVATKDDDASEGHNAMKRPNSAQRAGNGGKSRLPPSFQVCRRRVIADEVCCSSRAPHLKKDLN